MMAAGQALLRSAFLLLVLAAVASGQGPSIAPSNCICTLEYNPVCYNGRTYGNPCQAACAGAAPSSFTLGACAATPVATEAELVAALTAKAQAIQVTASITLSKELPAVSFTTKITGGPSIGLNAASLSRHITVTAGGDLTIDSLELSNGRITDNGGAIKVTGGTLTVTNSKFTQNKAVNSLVYGGGAIEVAGVGSKATVTGSTFTGNSAGLGGAIEASAGATLIVKTSTFTSNVGSVSGGAINVIDSAKADIQGSSFSQNNAPLGGAISVKSATALVCGITAPTANTALLGSPNVVALDGATVTACGPSAALVRVAGGALTSSCTGCDPVYVPAPAPTATPIPSIAAVTPTPTPAPTTTTPAPTTTTPAPTTTTPAPTTATATPTTTPRPATTSVTPTPTATSMASASAPTPAPTPVMTKEPNKGQAKGDPHMRGKNGEKYDFHGKPEKTYCLIADKHVHLNMHLMDGSKCPPPHCKPGMTFIREIALLYGNQRLMVSANSTEGTPYKGYHGTLVVNGETLPATPFEREFGEGLKVKRTSVKIYVEVEGVFKVRFDVARASFDPKGPGANYLNFKLDNMRLSDEVHGVLGQSYRPDYKREVARRARTQKSRYMEGKVKDYLASEMFATDCKFGTFQSELVLPAGEAQSNGSKAISSLTLHYRRRLASVPEDVPQTEVYCKSVGTGLLCL